MEKGGRAGIPPYSDAKSAERLEKKGDKGCWVKPETDRRVRKLLKRKGGAGGMNDGTGERLGNGELHNEG